mmetsp:Transcript_76520/g.159203  ORF Transcript_76520/g.159203 Transcript_76520/m.159203 type:complete len:93 (-) Transcript_76520:117-395(-)|eukprot:CAMPEP_0206449956 /NCGR_PEP_ID=MMETSP0324_2-20121206/18419_1 /ASSEMBLY_ACC=CAM_ASM_000836 /TAXON_ID=2866 /ORGANISM="Crypthecodinium cohnii, Strain Seligo" /LENGTH=92 /DNA_ID=CAMNT_0053919475 /DNA_START=130 /DNA_END=408 /DNA_ORIENTATION=-
MHLHISIGCVRLLSAYVRMACIESRTLDQTIHLQEHRGDVTADLQKFCFGWSMGRRGKSGCCCSWWSPGDFLVKLMLLSGSSGEREEQQRSE